jgi:O-methyltransferase
MMLNVRNFKLVSDQVEYAELEVIIRELTEVLKRSILGDVVELGCYSGTTSLFIQRILQKEVIKRSFHVYDSFSGLPEKTAEDSSPVGVQFTAGQLTASKRQLISHFNQARLPLPIIHKSWFEELRSNDMPEAIAFAFLDGDFYRSIKSSLQVITPRLSAGATVIIDDYHSEALPGAKQAVAEWVRLHNLEVKPEQSLAIIKWTS